MTKSSLGRPAFWFLLAAFTLIWFSNLEYRHLVKPDEGRYAEIPREMAATGDWTTPRLNGIKYFEKPALQYWATATAFELFGAHNWTARLWSALTGFLGVLMVYVTGKRLYGEQAGFYGALVAGSSLLYVLIGHINTLDMGVSFFMGLALSGFLLAQFPGASHPQNRFWMHVTWASLALAVLSKGLMGIVLPGAVLVLYTLWHQDWGLWKRLHLVSGLALFLLICAPWFIAVSLKNPEFFHFFFIHEHFDRFLTKEHGRYHPWYTFIPILLLGILPWLATMFDGLVRALRRDTDERQEFQPSRFLFLWAVFIFVFFSASDSKLPSYILPIFPALSLLIGKRLTELSSKALTWHLLPMLALAAVAWWMAPNVVDMADAEVPRALYQHYVTWLVSAAILWILGLVTSLVFIHHGRMTSAIVAAAFSSLIAWQLTLSGHESLSQSNSAYTLAEKVRPYLKPGIPFYSVGTYEQTLPFYIKRTLTLVAFKDEMAFGVEQEPNKWVPTYEQFVERWKNEKGALAIMTLGTYDRYKREGLPMEIVAANPRHVILRNPS